jgi:hypothetical protein
MPQMPALPAGLPPGIGPQPAGLPELEPLPF